MTCPGTFRTSLIGAPLQFNYGIEGLVNGCLAQFDTQIDFELKSVAFGLGSRLGSATLPHGARIKPSVACVIP
jgi:hypothetical protein